MYFILVLSNLIFYEILLDGSGFYWPHLPRGVGGLLGIYVRCWIMIGLHAELWSGYMLATWIVSTDLVHLTNYCAWRCKESSATHGECASVLDAKSLHQSLSNEQAILRLKQPEHQYWGWAPMHETEHWYMRLDTNTWGYTPMHEAGELELKSSRGSSRLPGDSPTIWQYFTHTRTT